MGSLARKQGKAVSEDMNVEHACSVQCVVVFGTDAVKSNKPRVVLRVTAADNQGIFLRTNIPHLIELPEILVLDVFLKCKIPVRSEVQYP